jgi:hypothetical protein
MTEPTEASLKVAKAPRGAREPQCQSGQLPYTMRGALYAPPESGLPYLAIVLNAQNEVLSARSVPSAEAGKNLISIISAAFASAGSSGISNKAKERHKPAHVSRSAP